MQCGRKDISDARQLTFEEDRRAFDWDRLQLTIRGATVVHGPLAVDPEGAAVKSCRSMTVVTVWASSSWPLVDAAS